MLDISISEKFKEEKEYILSVLIKDILGINYSISISEKDEYKFTFQNKSFSIEDHFFSNVTQKNYTTLEYLPSSIQHTTLLNTPIVILFGNDHIIEKDNKTLVSFDLPASAFFMLTRWEEIIIDKDEHARPKTSEMLAYKYDFHRRPVVNEWIELLWNLLKKIGINENERQHQSFQMQFSHDVDHPLLFPTFHSFIRQTAYQVLKARNISEAGKFINHYVSGKKDPYDTFDVLMEVSERNNALSQFNFMGSKKGRYDEGYDISSPLYSKIVNRIKERGHHFGFHPSYNSFDNIALWKTEKHTLENRLGMELNSGRQHYLRFENPLTWQIWEEMEMKEDATLGFTDEVGFRAGICYSYHPFDLKNKKKLRLLETPLLLMEGALINQLQVNPNEFSVIADQLTQEVKKYNGTFTVLWHNSSFFLDSYPKFKSNLKKDLVLF